MYYGYAAVTKGNNQRGPSVNIEMVAARDMRMPDYSFDVLNDKDLEHLVRDLLQAELDITLETFKSGKDDGVDLRYASAKANEGEIIVQVKHWYLTGLPKLLRHLEDKESKKVQELKPDRYIFATSVGLSKKNKSDIASYFRPYIRNTSDIYGRDDLNNLLQKYPDIEKSHNKLWISSTAVLQRVLHNAVSSRSVFVESEIKRKASLFVPTKNFDSAINILNKTHVLLIEGVPGVGKTTLAEFLVLKLLANGFKLVVIDGDLHDGEDVFDPDGRQVFYFDDFLGSNYLQLLHSKGSGASISRFVDRIIRDKKKRMILTTRTTILNRAYQQLHQLGQHKLSRSDFELHLDDYSRYDKARILYNHMFFCRLRPEFSEQIFKGESYFEIIDHENYNPRIIEFITDPLRLESVDASEYMPYVRHNLDHPDEIWEAAYENQIDANARFALDTLFSIGDSADDEAFRKAFDARLDYEVKYHGHQRHSQAFRNAIRLLLDGFITLEKSYASGGTYSFINPSVVDFLISRHTADPSDIWHILDSAIYLRQLHFRFGVKKDKPIQIGKSERARYRKLFVDRAIRMIGRAKFSIKLMMVEQLLTSFRWAEIASTCKRLIGDIDFESTSRSTFRMTHRIALSLVKKRDGKKVLIDRADEFLRGMLNAADSPDEVYDVVALFPSLDMDYRFWLSQCDNNEFVQQVVDAIWEYDWESYVDDDDRIQQAVYADEVETAIYELLTEAREMNVELGLGESPAFGEFDYIDVNEIVDKNQEAAAQEDYLANSGEDYSRTSGTGELTLIRELFAR